MLEATLVVWCNRGRTIEAIHDSHPRDDFNATILHLLGLDHERLTRYHNGIARRLTKVEGNVIDDVLL